MGIAKTLFEDWARERKIKKHRAQVDAILKKRGVRVTDKQSEYEQKKQASPKDQTDTQNLADEEMTMQTYDESGRLDADMEEMLQEKRLNQSVAAIINICKKQENQADGITVECSHDGTNVLISVFEGSNVVGKWRFIPLPANDKKPIHLYHLNYNYNQAPGPNYHLQKEACNIFTPEEIALYILRHDKKKAANDRRNHQTTECNTDDLIGE